MIYTIGYGNRSIEDFVRLLGKYHIQYLIDVRSKPYSRFNPDYTKQALEVLLDQNDIMYVFMGDALGGRPDDPDCFTPDGKISYTAIESKQFYIDGIERLQNAENGGHVVALMCSELKPEQCHRSKLIGETLTRLGIPVQHIDEQGNQKSQQTVIDIVRGRMRSDGQMALFETTNTGPLASRKSYVPASPQTEENKDGD